MGDYFLVGDLDGEILKPLRGVEYTREAVEALFAGIDPSTIIMNMNKRQLIEIFF